MPANERSPRSPEGRISSLQELLTPAFLEEHTGYASLDDLLSASELVEDPTAVDLDADVLRSGDWNEWVAENTKFLDWDELVARAVVDRFGDKIVTQYRGGP